MALIDRQKHNSLLNMFWNALLLSLLFTLMYSNFAFASGPRGLNIKALITMMKNFVAVIRLCMMFIIVIWGIALGFLMHIGETHAKKALSEYFLSAFFVFGATCIADAILAVTIGKFTINE